VIVLRRSRASRPELFSFVSFVYFLVVAEVLVVFVETEVFVIAGF
jgi:hypothetical protein